MDKQSEHNFEHLDDTTKTTIKNIKLSSGMSILLSIALIFCIMYDEEIDSFFGYDTQDTATHNTTYAESSYRTRPGSAFNSSRGPNNPSFPRDPISSSTPAPEPSFDFESSTEAMALFTPDPIPEPTSPPTPESTPKPLTSEPIPPAEPTSDPTPSSDLFSCLGIYEDDNGNSIELRLSTEFHTMSYAMRFHYNHGTAGLRGRDGQRTISNNSYVLFTVDYDGEEYPFTIQLGDGCILVDNSNCFGPFDGHEFAGTYYIAQQF